MKALILVGGIGTRLRPLTYNLPKPLVPFCGLPMVEWQIKSLVSIGITQVILAIGYKEELMFKFMEEMKKKYNIDIVCSVEKERLNTGGPLKLAEKYILTEKNDKEKTDFFFVLNSDVVCQYPLKEMIEYHKSHKGIATVLVTQVKNPSRFGIVVHDEKTLKVSQFVEKPKEFIGDFINAGMYIFDKKILEQIELKNISLERKIFPKIAEQGLMYVHRLKGYWKDIGLPNDFLKAQQILLNHMNQKEIKKLDDFQLINNQKNFIGINLIHKDVKVHESAQIGPFVVLYKNVKIGKQCILQRAQVMQNSIVHDNCEIKDSIIMNDVKIENNCQINQESIVGENMIIKENSKLTNQKKSNHINQLQQNEYYLRKLRKKNKLY